MAKKSEGGQASDVQKDKGKQKVRSRSSSKLKGSENPKTPMTATTSKKRKKEPTRQIQTLTSISHWHNNVKLAQLKKRIEECQDGHAFSRMFILHSLGTLLVSGNSWKISLNYAKYLNEDFSLIGQLNWGKLFVEACPWIQGINFDLPHVVSMAPEIEGVTHVGGDMFECVPKADAVFLMQVLHDWNDEDCIRILTKCRDAILTNGKEKVIIAEAVVDEEKDGELEYASLMLDMVMMAHTNSGKERNLKEWEYILHQAGFTRVTVTRIKAVQSIIQAFP
ncbi:Acetylserotonin O-methyltransferase [Linum perenne]